MFATMQKAYQETGMVLDPHTAIGVAAAHTHAEAGVPMVTLATASPAKFGAAVEKALGLVPALPPMMQGLLEAEERFTVLPNSIDAVKQAISGTQK
jgi:threonine synthase